ncbi:MAG: phosphate ABC transporter substrate-binding/OmpA family protein [Pseudomonadota bacterium]
MTADQDVSSSCSFHLIEVENLSGPLLTEGTVRALEASLTEAFDERFPEAACDARFVEGYGGADNGEIAVRLAEEGRPGFLYTLSFFPRGDGLLLLATAYRPDGRFAGFSNRVVVDTTEVEEDRPKKAADETSPDIASDNQPQSPPEASVPPRSTTSDNLAAIGTPEEIAAIKARKFAAMPPDPEPAQPPSIGLRIDIGGAVEPKVIEDLARAFLAEQSESSAPEAIVEDQNRIRLKGRSAAPLRGIEIFDSDRKDAFDQLFRGDVDLVVSSEPISQAYHDRFADAFGVDMRSGAGETVIGIDAVGFIVHASNELSSLTKELAARIFSGDVASWEEDNVAKSGLAGPIQALAQSRDRSVHYGYAIRPDLILNASAEIADLVAINPLSIGIANAAVIEGEQHRTLAIEECGIVYGTDEFFLRTEDHPLARRLFLYSNPAKGNRFRNAFLFFATSEVGQDLVGRHAVDLDAAFSELEQTRDRIAIIESQPTASPGLKSDLVDMIDGARRLSTTFRFRFDSPELRLDQHAARDLANLIRLSQSGQIDPRRLMLLGFADADGDAGYNEILSLERAEAIAKRLRTYGIDLPEANILGFGEEAPVACNTRPDGIEDDDGKARNRRVEIWLRDEVSQAQANPNR